MKRFCIAALICVSLLISSCAHGPRQDAERYVEALEAGRPDGAQRIRSEVGNRSQGYRDAFLRHLEELLTSNY